MLTLFPSVTSSPSPTLKSWDDTPDGNTIMLLSTDLAHEGGGDRRSVATAVLDVVNMDLRALLL